jgi:hypothetical protein
MASIEEPINIPYIKDERVDLPLPECGFRNDLMIVVLSYRQIQKEVAKGPGSSH